MPIRTPAHHNTTNPPGQIDRYPWLPKTLGEVIDKVVKSEERLAQPAEERTYAEGYSDGWRDAAEVWSLVSSSPCSRPPKEN